MKLFNDMETDFRSIVQRLTESMVKSNLISDTNTGSVAKLMAECFAREMAVFYSVLEKAHDAGYLKTAKGTALENIVAILGMRRAKEQLLKGTVTFSRKTPVEYDIEIPVGTKVTGPSLEGNTLPKLETVESASILSGELSVEVTVQEVYDEQLPPCDSLSSGALKILPRPITGIENVTNKEPITRNGKKEDDDHLRSRAEVILRESQTCTIEAIEAAVRGIGIETVKVMESPNGLSGSIEIHLEDPQLLINPKREVQIRDTIHRVKAAGIYIDLKFLKALYCQPIITVTLVESDMPEENFEQLASKIKEDVSAFINDLSPGVPVPRAKMTGLVISNSAVEEIINIDMKAMSIEYGPDGSEKIIWRKNSWQVNTLENALVNDRWPVMIIRKWPLKAVMNLTVKAKNGILKDDLIKSVRSKFKEYLNSVSSTLELDFKEFEGKLTEYNVKLDPTWIVHMTDGKVEDFNPEHNVKLENGEQVVIDNVDVIEIEKDNDE